MSKDTYTGQANDPLSLNLYTYCFNNPLIYWDPTGHVVTKDDELNLTPIGQALIQLYTDNYNTYNNAMKNYAKDSVDYYEYKKLRDLQGQKANDVRSSDTFDVHKQTNDVSSNSSSSNSTSNSTNISAAPATYTTNQQAQYYLNNMGFDIGGLNKGKPDGVMGVKSSSALIMTQWFAGVNVTGEVDEYTLKILKYLVEHGFTYDIICSFVNETWKPEKSTTDTSNPKNNGNLAKENLTRLPTASGGNAIDETNTAIAWSMLVQGAIQYNNSNKKEFGTLNINKFALSGTYAGYRPYHQQVEAWIDDIYLDGNPAYSIKNNFTDKNKANEWINKNKKNFKSEPIWDNVPDSVTQPGAPLAGYGASNHGWGVAIDFAVGGNKFGYAKTPEVRWLENNAEKYGFTGLIDHTDKNGIYYKETWHWEYMVK